MQSALVVDDDSAFASALGRALTRRGLKISVATDAKRAIAVAEAEKPDCAIVDLRIGADSGLALIAPLLAIRADMRIVVLTGYASIATAVAAVKRGAANYIAKPATAAAIMHALGEEFEAGTGDAPVATMTPLQRLAWEHIQQALTDSNGNISAAARLLGMHRRSLQRKLGKRPGLERPADNVARRDQ